MKQAMVEYEMDLSNPPALTAKQRAELEALRAKPESEIDMSDAPERVGGAVKKAVRNPFYRPVKESTTVRIDADVLHWLRSHGKGYQTRINTILRREMLVTMRGGAGKE